MVWKTHAGHRIPEFVVIYPVECFLEVNKAKKQRSFLRSRLLAQNSEVHQVIAGAPARPEASLFVGEFCLHFAFDSFEYDLQ